MIQTYENIINILCIHSKVSAHIIRDFENPSSLDDWLTLQPEDDEQTVRVDILHSKQDKSTQSQHLAVVFLEDKASLLYTTGRQCSPTCSNCFSRKCRCFFEWQKKLTEKDETKQTDSEQTDTEQSEPTVQTEDNNESSYPAHYLLNYNFHFPRL